MHAYPDGFPRFPVLSRRTQFAASFRPAFGELDGYAYYPRSNYPPYLGRKAGAL